MSSKTKKIIFILGCLFLLFLVSSMFFAPSHVQAQQITQQQLNAATQQNSTGSSNVTHAGEDKSCGFFGSETDVLQCFRDAIAWVFYGIIVVMAALLKLGGLLLDNSISYSIVNMAQKINGMSSINVAWKLLRDFANMAFIFFLLYTAIMTILQTSTANAKRTLVHIIIAALFINFSIFITKALIDLSNIVTLGFYNNIVHGNQTLSQSFMNVLHMQTIFGSGTRDMILGWSQSLGRLISMSVGYIAVMFVAAFSFAAAAFLLLYRYVILIIVIILSPLAFAAYGLPQLSKYAKRWQDALIGQVVFPILYMLLTLVGLLVLNNIVNLGSGGNFSVAFSNLTDTQYLSANQNGSTPGSFEIIINFIIIIIVMNAALIIAKQYAGQAGGAATRVMNTGLGYIDRARSRTIQAGQATARMGGRVAGHATLGVAGSALRHTVGKAGTGVAGSASLNKTALEGNVLTRNIAKAGIKAGQALGSATFDARNIKAVGDLAGKGVKGGYIQRTEEQADAAIKMVKQYGGASADTRTKMKDAQREIKAARERYYAAADPAAKEQAMRDLRAASEKYTKAERRGESERKDQQIAYMAWLGSSKSKSRLLLKTAAKYKRASQKFLKEVRPASTEDELKARVSDFKNQLKPALSAHNSAEVSNLLRQMKDNEIGKLDDTMFAAEDTTSPNGYKAVGEVIDNLKPGHLEAIKRELTSGQKNAIREYVMSKYTAPGAAPSAQITALAEWFDTNNGKSW